MRFLLLVALLFRLAPVPPGSEHCAAERAVAAVAAHHHGAGPAADHPAAPDHGECPHCPPADCVRQTQCAQGVGTFAPIATAPVLVTTTVLRSEVLRDRAVLASITTSPPVPPPVTALA